jgi:hypothetical protein
MLKLWTVIQASGPWFNIEEESYMLEQRARDVFQ